MKCLPMVMKDIMQSNYDSSVDLFDTKVHALKRLTTKADNSALEGAMV